MWKTILFNINLINLQSSLSIGSNVTITEVETAWSGKFSCEVSSDAPDFHTVVVSGDMEIVGEFVQQNLI